MFTITADMLKGVVKVQKEDGTEKCPYGVSQDEACEDDACFECKYIVSDDEGEEIECTYVKPEPKTVESLVLPPAQSFEKQFNGKDWFILHSGLVLNHADCPVCKKFSGNSFLFDFETDRDFYMGECEFCHSQMKILIPKEINNKIFDKIQATLNEIERKCEISSNKKYRYTIFVTPPNWEGYKYCIDYDKRYGSHGGGITEKKTLEELVDMLVSTIIEWESFDTGVERDGDRLTFRNTYFECYTGEITLLDLLNHPKIVESHARKESSLSSIMKNIQII